MSMSAVRGPSVQVLIMSTMTVIVSAVIMFVVVRCFVRKTDEGPTRAGKLN